MEAPSEEKVFITGINGFTGEHLEKKLVDQGFLVYGSTLSNPSVQNHFKCDILDEDILYEVLDKIRPDYIIHLAAISFVAAQDQKMMYDVNIFGTINLLNAIERLDYNPKKVLIASSAAVYGNIIEGELSEEMCPQPVNHYGNSKLVMENMAKQYFDRLNIIVVRPFNYTGIGQEKHFLIPKIVSHYKENRKEIELGNIEVYREFNNINFTLQSYLDLLFSDIKSDIINVCSGREINIRSILDIMDKIAGYDIKVKVNPKFIRKNEIKVLKGSTKKLFSNIKDYTEEYTLEDTLIEMYKN